MNEYQIVRTDVKPSNNIIFFGENYGNLLRVDDVSHSIAKTLKEFSEGNTWFSREVNMKDDKTKFDLLPEDAKRAFKLNIIYQTLMDSGITAGISDTIIRCITSPIWDILYRRISIEECIHAESYSYCLNEVFGSETSDIIDLVYSDKVVQKRMENEQSLFKNLYELLNDDKADLETKKKALLMVFIATYCLEGIKFPFSFLVTFTINDSYSDAIPGFTQNIRLIANDELNTHVPTSLNLFNILRTDDKQGFYHLFNNTNKDLINDEKPFFFEKFDEYVDKIVDQEVEWAYYLFDNKEVKGLNVKIAEYFIKHRANLLYRNLDIKDNKYKKYVKNSITDFFENYRDINKLNSALQEVSNIAYIKGTVKNDL